VVLGVIGGGGPDGTLDAIRGTINFVFQGTPYIAARWLTAAQMAPPVRLLFIGSAVAIIVWAFWPHAKVRDNEEREPTEFGPLKSLRDLFEEDCAKFFSLGCDLDAEIDEEKTTARLSVAMDMAANAKWPTIYIPRSPKAFRIAGSMADKYMALMDELIAGIEITSAYPGDSGPVSNKDLRFSGRVYIYHEDYFDVQQIAALDVVFRTHGALLILRGPNYVATRMMSDRSANVSSKARLTDA
jgi:hypothetical protein